MVLIELAEDECRVAVFDVFVFVFVFVSNSLKFMLFKKVQEQRTNQNEKREWCFGETRAKSRNNV